MSTMQVDDLMRQAGLDAIADKDSRAAAGQEMTAPEQDRYDAIVYFAGLVAQAARAQACELEDLAHSAHEEAMQFGLSHDLFMRYFRRLLGEDAGRGES